MADDQLLHKIYRPRRFHNWEELPRRGSTGSGGMPFPPPPEDADDHTRYVAHEQGWLPLGEPYVHQQDVPAMRWTVQHNRGQPFPRIVVLNETGQNVMATVDWDHATLNYLELLFAIPSRGTAYIA